MREHESIGAKRPPERCSGGRPLVSCWECSGVPVSLVCLRIPFRTGLHLAAARREVRRPQQILFWRAERTCGRVHEALCLEFAVSALRRRPRGLRLAEEVQQLPLSELSERCVGTLGSQRRIASKAALALGAGAELEQQPKLILPINGDAARGINLPDLAVYYDGGPCQGRGHRRHVSPGRWRSFASTGAMMAPRLSASASAAVAAARSASKPRSRSRRIIRASQRP